MNILPSASSISWTVQMLGWSRAAAAWASRENRSFACESYVHSERKEFEGDSALELAVLRLIDDAHPSPAQLFDDLVSAGEYRAWD